MLSADHGDRRLDRYDLRVAGKLCPDNVLIVVNDVPLSVLLNERTIVPVLFLPCL